MTNVIQELTGQGKYSDKLVKIVDKTRGNTSFQRFRDNTHLSLEDLKIKTFKAILYELGDTCYKIQMSSRENDYYLFNESDLRLANGNNYYEES